MSAIAGEQLSPLPWTRARATRNWKGAFAGIAGTRVLLLFALPAFSALSLAELLDDIARATLFPLLFLGMVVLCERRFLRRPPKTLLALQLLLFCVGVVLHMLSVVSAPHLAGPAAVVLAANPVLLGGWFVGVLLVPEE